MRVGMGYDSHRLVEGRALILGGVRIPHEKGLHGHSDADVLAHAVIDAIIGALGLGDIGTHFPDTDPQYKGADSMELLRQTVALAHAEGYAVTWADVTVICEQPKLAPYKDQIKANLMAAGIKGANVKAKTNEGMDATGRGEGIVAYAVCTVMKSAG